MAITLKDRVKVTSGITGTGTATLGAALTGFQSFAIIGDGNQTYYTIALQSGDEWEVGIGTVTDTAGTFTLSRDTVLESSNAGSLVDFSAGTKDVFVTYPAERAVYLNAAGTEATALNVGTLGATAANLTTATITSGTVSTTPANNTDIANKEYVDNLVSSGTHFHEPVRVESPINLNATYDNGTDGVGATLTNAGAQVALEIDGITMVVADRVLIYEQTNQTQNGVYVVTDVGSGAANWILTRSADANTSGLVGPDTLSEGSTFFVQAGATGAGETYTCNVTGAIIFGTTNITFAQISSAQIYSAGTGLTLSGTQFSITNTGTAGTYGAAASVPVFTTNAQGQVTGVTNTAISITSAAVSGLAASATTDTTNASNITSGALGTERLSGSYTGITGVGTLTAGTWSASTILANRGGTGFASYAVGDLLYADTTTTLDKLPGVAVGNALISGGVGAAPTYGKIGLATHVSGTLPVANGGTGVTSSTGTGSVVLSSSPTLVTPALGTPASGNLANCTFPTLNQNTTGNAATATALQTARTINGVSFNGTANVTVTTAGTGIGVSGTAVSIASTYSPDTALLLGGAQDLNTYQTAGFYFQTANANASSGSNYPAAQAGSFVVQKSAGVTQQYYTYNTNSAEMYYRAFYNGTWGAWRRVITDVNYNSFAPTLTGTGASGTWGISVTGNAATATALQTARAINGTNFNGTAAITTANWGTARTLTIGATGKSVNGSGNVSWTLAEIGAAPAASAIPAGTKMMFVQTAAPTGWTKDTTHNDKALRVVSGTASTGGTVAFTTAFASKEVHGTVGNTTLTESQIPSHNHSQVGVNSLTGSGLTSGSGVSSGATANTGARGGSSPHNHSFTGTAINMAVQYVDVIIATKN